MNLRLSEIQRSLKRKTSAARMSPEVPAPTSPSPNPPRTPEPTTAASPAAPSSSAAKRGKKRKLDEGPAPGDDDEPERLGVVTQPARMVSSFAGSVFSSLTNRLRP